MEATSGVSRTAVMTAVARALGREARPPHVLDDHLALPLAGPEGARIRAQLEAELPTDGLEAFSRWCCVRSRFPEDIVEHELVENGTRQYVVLGAGLDTFAERRPDLLKQLRVFEVDHPATQLWKRTQLERLGVLVSPNLTFAPVDFEHETLADGLRSAGFDFDGPAVFAWIGVTMFLSLDAIVSTLDLIANCAAGTRVVLTYNLPQAALNGLGARTQTELARICAEMDEPLVSLFTPGEIEGLMSDHGFTDLVHVGPDEAIEMYFKDLPDVTFGGAQRIIAGTVRS
jgi:methyltransferase (TIGR00027 family)